MRILSRLAMVACFFAFCVIGLGAFTRLIDAGLGCPDWPGCYGKIIPTLSGNLNEHFVAYKAWAEMIHRYAVGVLSLLISIIILTIFFNKNLRVIYNVFLAVILCVLLIYQILLGQFTVTLKLMPFIVTQHLLGGFLIFIVLWLLYLKNHNTHQIYFTQRKLILLGGCIALILLLCQIFLGAWTSTNYASLSCPAFPFCTDDNVNISSYLKDAFHLSLLPGVNYEGGILKNVIRQAIQMTHRMGALIFSIYFFIFSILAVKKMKKNPDVIKTLYLTWFFICLQISLGIINVIFKLPLLTAIAHNLTAALLLLTLITLLFKFLLVEPKEIL